MNEIIVVHGNPGAGKSTLCERLTQHTIGDSPVFHVSAGNRLRDIRTRRIESAFSSDVNGPNAPDPLTPETVNGVVIEGISQYPAKSLILVDGFPRFRNTIGIFLESLRQADHTLLGCLNLTISKETSIRRMLARGVRLGEKASLTSREAFGKRYDDYNSFTDEAIATMAGFIPVININAEPDMEDVWKFFYSAVERLGSNTQSASD